MCLPDSLALILLPPTPTSQITEPTVSEYLSLCFLKTIHLWDTKEKIAQGG